MKTVIFFLFAFVVMLTSCNSASEDTGVAATLVGKTEKSVFKIIPEWAIQVSVIAQNGENVTVLMNRKSFFSSTPKTKGHINLDGKFKYFIPNTEVDLDNVPVTLISKKTGLIVIAPVGYTKYNAVFPSGDTIAVSVSDKDGLSNKIPFTGYAEMSGSSMIRNILFHKEKILMHL